MRPVTRCVALVATTIFLVLTPPRIVPSLADHGGRNGDTGTIQGHWWHGPGQVSVPPIYDRNVTMRGGVNLFADAASFWGNEAAQSIRPFLASTGGNPYDCSPLDWAIVVCVADLGHNDVGGRTTVWRFDGIHIGWAVIQINWNHKGGFSDSLLKRVVRHELGHGVGLGHTLWCGSFQSVMYPAPSTISACQHDRDAIQYLYQAHHH